MRQALRRTAVATTATVVAGLAVIPLTAGTALAVGTPTETQFYAADVDDDGFTGLYSRTTPSGAPTTLVAESETTDVSYVSASRDGSRFVDIESVYSATTFDLVSQRLVVRDVSGQAVRVVETVKAASYRDSQPALSPDGKTLVWRQFDVVHHTHTLRKAAVSSGGSTVIGHDYGNPVFLDDTTLLVESDAGPWYTLPVAGGTAQAANGISQDAWQPAVSVNGDKIAWSLYTGTGNDLTFDIQVATLAPLSGGVATVSGVTTLATGLDNERPAFSRDGSTISFIKYDDNAITSRLYTVPTAGGSATEDTTVGHDVWEAAYGTTDDGTVPGDATAGTATLLGTSATLHWTLPADTGDLSGVRITRTGAQPVYVPAPLTSGTVTGLTAGSTYTFTITAVDRSGNPAATGSPLTLTAVQALPSISTPTSRSTTRAPFTVRFASTAPADVTFTVDYRVNSGATWTPWVTGAVGATRVFGSAATAGVNATTSAPGATYQFRVTAHDAHGNSTPTVASASAVVPYDQTVGSYAGNVRLSTSNAWYGSYQVIKSTSSYARVVLTGNQLQVVGWKCKTCGQVAIYDNNVKIGTVDTYSATTVARTVLFTKTFSSSSRHIFALRPLATAGRPNVIIDGYAMRR